MKRTRIMKALYGSLIGIVALVVWAPLAIAKAPPGGGGHHGGEAPAPSFPSWDQQIETPGRFILLSDFADAAVLDQETGLVWEQSPETEPNPPGGPWLDAQVGCNTHAVGGRRGWRLPTLQELASLIDPTQSHPALPSGHPFRNVWSAFYWSATTTADNASYAWGVDFGPGSVAADDKSHTLHVWCVRGGQGVNPQ